MKAAFNFVENAIRYNPTENNTLKILHPNTMIFTLQDKQCSFKLKNGLITYDGDLDESAKILFNKVCELFNKESDNESQETLLAELAECIIANKNGLCSTHTILSKFKITRK